MTEMRAPRSGQELEADHRTDQIVARKEMGAVVRREEMEIAMVVMLIQVEATLMGAGTAGIGITRTSQ